MFAAEIRKDIGWILNLSGKFCKSKIDYCLLKAAFFPPASSYTYLLNVLILIAFVSHVKFAFSEKPNTAPPQPFLSAWVLIISADCRQKMNIRHILRLKTCSLLLQFIAEEDICPFPVKRKVQLRCMALCLKPGIIHTRLSLLAPCLSSTFWYLCGWLAGTWMGGSGG